MSKVFEFYISFSKEISMGYLNKKGEYIPFSLYIKEQFKKYPKAGSRDRKTVSQLDYTYFRTGKAFIDLGFEKKLALSTFLCEKQQNPLNTFVTEKFGNDLINKIESDLNTKITYLNTQYNLNLKNEDLFVPHIELSHLTNRDLFYLAQLEKPHTYIRVRNTKNEEVTNELTSAKIEFKKDAEIDNCYYFSGHPTLTELQSFSKGFFEIQDRSSQLVLNNIEVKAESFWWDACCASGGKSLLLLEKNKNIRIFASDVRQSILDNYKKRISKVGFGNHETRLIDLASQTQNGYTFDGIICDVPCTGSGTWARTPEQIEVFKTETISTFKLKQQAIVRNASQSLRKNGILVYITCSVFKDENENQVKYIQENLNLTLIESNLIEGAKQHADTMFVAVFKKEI